MESEFFFFWGNFLSGNLFWDFLDDRKVVSAFFFELTKFHRIQSKVNEIFENSEQV